MPKQKGWISQASVGVGIRRCSWFVSWLTLGNREGFMGQRGEMVELSLAVCCRWILSEELHSCDLITASPRLGWPFLPFLSSGVPNLPRLREAHGGGLMALPGLRVSE